MSKSFHINPYVLSTIVTLAVLFVIRWGFVCVSGDYEPDGYFHIKIAEQGPSVFLAKEYPWLSMTTWCKAFSDKEMLFHVLLWLLLKVGALLGASNEYPFHYQTLFFNALLFISFNVLLCKNKVRHPWLYSLLAVIIFPSMAYRLMSLRAYLLSMTLSTIMLTMLLDSRFRQWKWRWLATGLMGMLAAWSYSSPHLILFIITPFALGEFLCTKKWRHLLLSPCAFVLGIACGLLLHPQFPNTLLMFKIQCIDVVLAFFLHLEQIPLNGGREFYLCAWRFIFNQGGMYYVLALLIICTILLNKKRFLQTDWCRDCNFTGMLLVFLVTAPLSYKIFRFNEYAIFPQVFFLGWLFSRLQEDKEASENKKDNEHQGTSPQCLTYRIALFFFLASLCLFCRHLLQLRPQGMAELPCYGVAKWAEECQIPKGTVIGNIIWSDFPLLYYAMPQYRYTWGLDPAFSWHYDKSLINMLDDMLKNKYHTPQEFAKALNSKYLFISLEFDDVAAKFWRAGFIPIYADWDGWIFDLDLPARKVTEDTPKLRHFGRE